MICISLQTDNHASTSPLSFYRPDALLAVQPKRQSTEGTPLGVTNADNSTLVCRRDAVRCMVLPSVRPSVRHTRAVRVASVG